MDLSGLLALYDKMESEYGFRPNVSMDNFSVGDTVEIQEGWPLVGVGKTGTIVDVREEAIDVEVNGTKYTCYGTADMMHWFVKVTKKGVV